MIIMADFGTVDVVGEAGGVAFLSDDSSQGAHVGTGRANTPERSH